MWHFSRERSRFAKSSSNGSNDFILVYVVDFVVYKMYNTSDVKKVLLHEPSWARLSANNFVRGLRQDRDKEIRVGGLWQRRDSWIRFSESGQFRVSTLLLCVFAVRHNAWLIVRFANRSIFQQRWYVGLSRMKCSLEDCYLAFICTDEYCARLKMNCSFFPVCRNFCDRISTGERCYAEGTNSTWIFEKFSKSPRVLKMEKVDRR